MARKPVEQLSPAYRRRIERAEAKGKSRQEARGKKAGEHIVRKQKELGKTGVTPSQRQAIRKFASEQIDRWKRTGVSDLAEQSVTEVADEIVTWIANEGDYTNFIELRNEQRRLKKMSHGNMKLTDFIALESPYNAPIEWFYYH